MKTNTKAHLLMILLLCAWGFDYVPAKLGLSAITPMQLLFFRYVAGMALLGSIMLIKRVEFRVKLKDMPVFVLCAIFGQIGYFWCEYTALETMQASLITIVLSLLPVVSIATERVLYKRRYGIKIVAGSLVCILGVILVMGGDFGVLFSGKGKGYILCFGAVILWNAYNFITSSIREYDAMTVTFMQMLTATVMLTPYVIMNPPELNAFTPMIIGGIIYIGAIDAGLGLLIEVYCLRILGPTTSALYSEFMPVTATLAAWAFMHESISTIQILGGIVVIAAGYIVIKEKGKSEELRND